MRRRLYLAAIAAAIVMALLLPGSSTNALAQGLPPHVFARTYHAMGTDVVLTAFTTDDARADEAFAAGMDEIRRIERLMTDWEWPGHPPSDVLRVNAAAGRQSVHVADETFEEIAKSLDMS
ncbi:MAG: hypothetical protein H7X95_07510, partial [Deltaproteobacteria bacterium]|nr:hypothetical protein [Deltaproteobacteria bacterium]